MTEFNDKELQEKTDRMLKEFTDESKILMESTITIKFISKTLVDVNKLDSDEHRKEVKAKLENELKEVTDSIRSWVNENINANENTAILEFSVDSEPCGLRKAMASKCLKNALSDLVKSL